MLEVAQKYANQLTNKMTDIWYNEKYKFWNCNGYFSTFKLDEDNWNRYQFVSVNECGRVIGFIEYSINRQTYNVNGLNIINFEDVTTTFSNDVGEALIDIFEKFNFNKLNFEVIIGNPIEKSYDKLIERYGGRVVGIYKNEVKLFDGSYYDEKLYEITGEEYFNAKYERERKAKEEEWNKTQRFLDSILGKDTGKNNNV